MQRRDRVQCLQQATLKAYLHPPTHQKVHPTGKTKQANNCYD